MLVRKGTVALARPLDARVADLMFRGRGRGGCAHTAIAGSAALLADLHGDPADRPLVATALARRPAVGTKDRLLHAHAATSDAFTAIW